MVSCITLLSDFGLRDASAAIARGILMQHTNLPIVDISHEITPFLASQAAYLLGSSYKAFPPGTVHLVLFDVFSNPDMALILSEHNGHYFLAPDSGIVAAALDASPASWSCILNGKETFDGWLNAAAGVIGSLQESPAAALNLPPHTLLYTPAIPLLSDSVECDIIHIDQFENVVLSIKRSQFESRRGGRNFRLQFVVVEEIEELSNSYSDVREGFKLCRFNSSGHLEICINRGRAASLFGLRLGSKHNNIKILFE
jgi:S-adenosylmethionine hydrolase